LGRAVKSGRSARNAALYVDAPAKATHELRPFTVEEVADFRKAIARHRFEALFLTALGTGLRQGELLGLRWSDVDLDAGTLTVRHTLARYTAVLADPKTEKSRRVLRLPLPVTVALKRLKVRQDGERAAARRWTAAGYVFTNRTGGPLDSRHVTETFQAVLSKAGIRRQRFHDLRHAFATLQLEAGAELFDVSRALGHADIGTTANVYAHFTEAMADRMADRMAGILEAVGDR
jgi:integrase